MPKIKMLETSPGSSDGIHVGIYEKGKEYDVSGDLMKNFVVDQGIATVVRERKALVAAPDNAAVEAAPENAESPEETEKENMELEQEEPKKVAVMRVFQLADELGVSSKAVIKKAKKCGIFVSVPASGLSEEEVKKIKNA